MRIQTALPSDDPMMVAFGEYQSTPEYQNSFKWAEFDQHRDGSMWAAFTAGYDAATRSAAGPDAQGWRLLDVGEVIQEGDEVFNDYKQWSEVYASVGDTVFERDTAGQFLVRRRLPAAPAMSVTQALIDAGIELHNASDDNSKYISGLCKNWRKALADYEKLSPTNAPQVISRVNFDTRETELIVTQAAVGDVGADTVEYLSEIAKMYEYFPDENFMIHISLKHLRATVTALGKGG